MTISLAAHISDIAITSAGAELRMFFSGWSKLYFSFLPPLGFDSLCFLTIPCRFWSLEASLSPKPGVGAAFLSKKVLPTASACPANAESQPGPLPPRAASSPLISCLAMSSAASPAPSAIPSDTYAMTVQLVAWHRCWRWGLSKLFSWRKTNARIQVTSQAVCCPHRAGPAWLEVTEAPPLALTSAGMTDHIQEMVLRISCLFFFKSTFSQIHKFFFFLRSGAVLPLVYLCLSVLLNTLVGHISLSQQSNSHS